MAGPAERAKEALGTSTYREAITQALEEAVSRAEMRVLVDELEASDVTWGLGEAVERLSRLLDGVPVVGADREIGEIGGRLEAIAHWNGQVVPLLTCDSDFGRGRALASLPEAGPWAELRLHPASVT